MRAILLISVVCAASLPDLGGQDHTGWRDYGGGSDSAQYSALDQVNRSNVSRLELAWRYAIGDGKKYSFNPVIVDDLMFVMGKNNSIVALNATTGKEAWAYAPDPAPSVITNRGIN